MCCIYRAQRYPSFAERKQHKLPEFNSPSRLPTGEPRQAHISGLLRFNDCRFEVGGCGTCWFLQSGRKIPRARPHRKKLTLAQHIPREGDADAGHGALDVVLQSGRHGCGGGVWKNERVLQFDLAPIASLPCQSRGVAGAALRKKCLSAAHLIFDEHDDKHPSTFLYWRPSTANATHIILAWASSSLDIVVLGICLGRCLCLCREEFCRATRTTGKCSQAQAAAGKRT